MYRNPTQLEREWIWELAKIPSLPKKKEENAKYWKERCKPFINNQEFIVIKPNVLCTAFTTSYNSWTITFFVEFLCLADSNYGRNFGNTCKFAILNSQPPKKKKKDCIMVDLFVDLFKMNKITVILRKSETLKDRVYPKS